MNENFEKFRELLVPNRAVLVIGEVNNGEDRPKLFPQEILALEEAVVRYTKQVHFRLHAARMTPDTPERVRALTDRFPGTVPLFLCLVRPGGEVVFIEAHDRYRVAPSRELQQAADEAFGADTYHARIEAVLPERAPRRWERKRGEEGGEA
jgi:DNA polymerase III alpha subunit